MLLTEPCWHSLHLLLTEGLGAAWPNVSRHPSSEDSCILQGHG